MQPPSWRDVVTLTPSCPSEEIEEIQRALAAVDAEIHRVVRRVEKTQQQSADHFYSGERRNINFADDEGWDKISSTPSSTEEAAINDIHSEGNSTNDDSSSADEEDVEEAQQKFHTSGKDVLLLAKNSSLGTGTTTTPGAPNPGRIDPAAASPSPGGWSPSPPPRRLASTKLRRFLGGTVSSLGAAGHHRRRSLKQEQVAMMREEMHSCFLKFFLAQHESHDATTGTRSY